MNPTRLAAALVAGGSFTCSITAILMLAVILGLGDRAVLAGLVAVCALIATTMLVAATRLRP
ncbi:hypothetical protein Ade02nite_61780 [Paractinoplanes deccanensis]|uniref:Uncharacterized protein n=1 Tax=Paractinoplanes deccanensis TaxID=113561 RepID=A0ABQ3YBZ5_9ACTN|nr:hypothetical protein [Actinoplanes deccanensis]GID77537.1 hypothetical protein Ade02nite_61780 [Actinoplanes deccanensis]